MPLPVLKKSEMIQRIEKRDWNWVGAYNRINGPRSFRKTAYKPKKRRHPEE